MHLTDSPSRWSPNGPTSIKTDAEFAKTSERLTSVNKLTMGPVLYVDNARPRPDVPR